MPITASWKSTKKITVRDDVLQEHLSFAICEEDKDLVVHSNYNRFEFISSLFGYVERTGFRVSLLGLFYSANKLHNDEHC